MNPHVNPHTTIQRWWMKEDKRMQRADMSTGNSSDRLTGVVAPPSASVHPEVWGVGCLRFSHQQLEAQNYQTWAMVNDHSSSLVVINPAANEWRW